MIWWVFFLTILTIMSYLTDVGILTFLRNLRIPFLDASLLSVLLLLCTLGILVRMFWMKRKGEKENLRSMIVQLERKFVDQKEV